MTTQQREIKLLRDLERAVRNQEQAAIDMGEMLQLAADEDLPKSKRKRAKVAFAALNDQYDASQRDLNDALESLTEFDTKNDG